MPALTQEQLDSFSRDGFLPYEKILTDDEITLLRAEYDREFDRAESGGHFRNLSADADASYEEQKATKTRMLQIMMMCNRNIHFNKLIYNPRILDVVEDLIGPNIMLYHDQALFKPAFYGGEVTWHQDNAYWRCRPASLVSCWLTLDDVDESNGAMQLIRGSHLNPVWHDRNSDKSILIHIKDDLIDKSKMQTVCLPAGGCMFHHCQTLHHTDPNTTYRQRRAFAIHFMVPGTTRDGVRFDVGRNNPILRMRI